MENEITPTDKKLAVEPAAAKIEQVPLPEPAPKVEKPVRIFVYDGREFSDPDAKMTTEEVRLYYAGFFPELANAEVLSAIVRPSKSAPGTQESVTEFKRRTGTKGIDPLLSEKEEWLKGQAEKTADEWCHKNFKVPVYERAKRYAGYLTKFYRFGGMCVRQFMKEHGTPRRKKCQKAKI
jgi:PRTRC genetic system protein C